MAVGIRRSRRSTNIWPGFVDALATLLLVLIFLVMVFVLAQFFLNEALSGRNQALGKLQNEIAELADLLALERSSNRELRESVATLSSDLQASVAARDALSSDLATMTERAQAAESLSAEQAEKIMGMTEDLARLEALRDELRAEITSLAAKADEQGKALLKERDLAKSARAEAALMNRQLAELKDQLKNIQTALEISERKNAEQEAKVIALGKRLNAALASKVQELQRYRSEFFGRLREALGDQPGIRIHGDRFIFQSEVLFASGEAKMEGPALDQIDQLADTLQDVMSKIPDDIDWVLRVDGHTDDVPISTGRFPSNWELSAARAISVVKRLIDQDIPPSRLVAAGFGEFQPLDPRKDEIAKRRNRRIELKLTQR